jgi:hypothetical protein
MSYQTFDNTRLRFRFARAIGSACIVAIGVTTAHGAQATESWQVLLAHQLQQQQRCKLDKVLFVQDVPVGTNVTLRGRIRCEDSREYDFERERPSGPFTIRLCQPAVC